ncbi:hypothetical protein A464_2577 [Salmonella bongori N268-08]|uniref:Uncharacterized protein n=1 Tax=Salmonella bongori N268-08 TaxID=1197719 RepID=S5NHL8_SALBN|nr:hypothetical protein A464_2577 [Salmonella bongori N268-08]
MLYRIASSVTTVRDENCFTFHFNTWCVAIMPFFPLHRVRYWLNQMFAP